MALTMQSFMNFANKVATGTLFDAAPTNDEERRATIEKMFASYKAKSFPNVHDAEPKEIQKDLEAKADADDAEAKNKPVLVDCRPKGEQVSSVPGSIREEDLKVQDVPKDTEIVLYCTVGYRSGVKAAQLQKEYPDHKFANLKGGILLWAHDVGKVVDGQGKDTKTIHVYGKAWDFLPDGWTSVMGEPDKLEVLTAPQPKKEIVPPQDSIEATVNSTST